MAPAKKASTKTPATGQARPTAEKAPSAASLGTTSPAAGGPARRTPATRRPATRATGRAASAAVSAAAFTPAELRAVRAALVEDVERLLGEVAVMDGHVADLVNDPGDGAGDDATESGSKAFELEHEKTLANTAREAVSQSHRALGRIDAGTYGTCETCGEPIAKKRLQAFPRVTLCVRCKAAQERASA